MFHLELVCKILLQARLCCSQSSSLAYSPVQCLQTHAKSTGFHRKIIPLGTVIHTFVVTMLAGVNHKIHSSCNEVVVGQEACGR